MTLLEEVDAQIRHRMVARARMAKEIQVLSEARGKIAQIEPDRGEGDVRLRPAPDEGAGPQQQKVLDALRTLGVATRAEVAAAAGVSAKSAAHNLLGLSKRGLAFSRGRGMASRWSSTEWTEEEAEQVEEFEPATISPALTEAPAPAPLTSLRTLRQQVINQIQLRPGEMTEEAIARELGVERDDVADVCGRLLLDDDVVFHPDQTYSMTLESERAA